MGKKILIIEKNLIEAMSLERLFVKLGATSLGIATDYFTTMVLINDSTPDLVFVNPNLTLESEGLDVVHEVLKKITCKIYFFSSKISPELKNKISLLGDFESIDESSTAQLEVVLTGCMS
jgi:hypothetical protein